MKEEVEKETPIDKAKLRPISESQRSCLECYYGSQLLGGSPAWCLYTGNKIHELVGCELWRKEIKIKQNDSSEKEEMLQEQWQEEREQWQEERELLYEEMRIQNYDFDYGDVKY